MLPGYYHCRQIDSLRLDSGRGDPRFFDVKIVEGELPLANPTVFKDEYLFVNKDNEGRMFDDDASYKDYQEFHREVWNNKVT